MSTEPGSALPKQLGESTEILRKPLLLNNPQLSKQKDKEMLRLLAKVQSYIEILYWVPLCCYCAVFVNEVVLEFKYSKKMRKENGHGLMHFWNQKNKWKWSSLAVIQLVYLYEPHFSVVLGSIIVRKHNFLLIIFAGIIWLFGRFPSIIWVESEKGPYWLLYLGSTERYRFQA